MSSVPQEFADLSRKLSTLKQGDFTYSEKGFVWRFEPKQPLTQAAQSFADEQTETDVIFDEVDGLVVLSQTCDIVKSPAQRPFLEVCPLKKVDQHDMQMTKKNRLPQYAWVPGAETHEMIADLDRVMTIEKSMILSWDFQRGCSSHDEEQTFARSLARKRSRPAFPDDFVECIKKFQSRCIEKHDKKSDLGWALQKIKEIRILAEPSWDMEPPIKIILYFLTSAPLTDPKLQMLDKEVRSLMTLISNTAVYEFDFLLTDYTQLSAADYLKTTALDLDYLSK